MQIESYDPQELATKGDRIQVPASSGAAALAPVVPPPPTPRLIAVFGAEIRKRKGLLGVWLALTAVVAGAAVFKFAKPLYRAEGKFSYIPNYRGGPNALYNPPNIQTAMQMLRSAEVLEPVRQAHVPDMSKDDFGKAVRVEITKQSEFLDVSFDHPNPAVAVAVANDLQTRGVAHFKGVREKALATASVQLSEDYRRALDRVEKAKEQVRTASRAKGVSDLPAEKKAAERAIEDIERALREARDKQVNLKQQIMHQTALRDAPPNPNERSVDTELLTVLQAQMNQLQNELQNDSKIDEAKRELAIWQPKEEQYRDLYARNVIYKADLDEVVLKVQSAKDTIRRWTEKQSQLTVIRTQHQAIIKQAGSGKGVRREVQNELDRLRRELEAVPTTINNLKEELATKERHLKDLQALEKELGPLVEEETVYRRRFEDFAKMKTESDERTRDVNADDLSVVGAADVPAAPYSSNAPKLALGIAGASGLLFLGYIGLVALPQLTPNGPPSGALEVAETPAVPTLPRALIALVPYMRDSNGHAGTNGTLAESPPEPAEPPVPEPEARTEPFAPEVEVEPVPPEAEPLPPAEPPVEVKPAPVEQVEDFGSPVPTAPARKPEPRLPAVPDAPAVNLEPVVTPAPVKAESPAPAAKRDPIPRIVSLPVLKPVLPLPPGLAPMPEAPKPAPVAKPVVRAAGPVRALADRIVEENVGRGGIVLFAPTVEQLRVTPVIGDLGKILTDRGDRVLVFDARPAAETPAWAGAKAPTVTGFLAGQSAAGLGACFAPTVLKGVEYSRGDLSGKLDGVMAAHRFRQLVEEMQERYSLVLMVSPPVTLDGSDPMLANLAEGMVLVTESTAPSADVHAYIESLSKRVAAPLYGTLTVPRA